MAQGRYGPNMGYGMVPGQVGYWNRGADRDRDIGSRDGCGMVQATVSGDIRNMSRIQDLEMVQMW